MDSINPDKDADGFHPLNVGKLSVASHNDKKLLMPCTPYGCLLMLKDLKIDLVGKNAVIKDGDEVAIIPPVSGGQHDTHNQ